MRVFNEQQRFTQSWLIALVGVSILVPVGLMTKELMQENSTMSTVEFVIILGSMLLFTLPLFIIKLTSRIDEKGIHYRFFPFHRSVRTILWSEIRRMYVRQYNPIAEYGGWGIKPSWNKGHGLAVNVAGDVGLQLELNNGKKFLLGTQKEDEVKRIIANYQSKLNNNERP